MLARSKVLPKLHDKERCMCDECIKFRVRERAAQREADTLAASYIERRGGLDRPANRKD